MTTLGPTLQYEKRQLWALPTPTDTSTEEDCRTFTLPSGGSLVININTTVTFTTSAIYQPPCTGSPAFINSADGADNGTQPIDSYRDPFYASTTPQVYIVAMTTAMAWILLITLLMFQPSYLRINTRPLVQPWRRGDGFLTLFTSRSSPLPLGTRPWLQRFAALMIVISMTTVTTGTFKNAQTQYNRGYSDAQELRNEVAGSLEVRCIRVVSDLFLWLAQVQTMIRLFPRRKEKLVIKWVGFVLILLDIIFSCLNSFYIDKSTLIDRPRRYQDAIPALSYLFQLALNLLYAAWVLYFVMTKRRYAFYHHMMPEICIIALVSLLSISTPVVFFLVDILEPDVGAWGDYFRWIGSAAASILIWEWVERIEYLEREEKKDGILGREIFEEDDDEDSQPGHRGSRHESSDVDEKGNRLVRQYRKVVSRYDMIGGTVRRFRKTNEPTEHPNEVNHGKESSRRRRHRQAQVRRVERGATGDVDGISLPPPVASPLSRTDDDSPSSTIYAVHYHPTTQTPPLINKQLVTKPGATSAEDSSNEPPNDQSLSSYGLLPSLQWPVNLFRKPRQSPPVEVKNALSQSQGHQSKASAVARGKVSDILEGLSSRRERRRSIAAAIPTEPTVIPPPARGMQPWTPDSMNRIAQNSPARLEASQAGPIDADQGFASPSGHTQSETRDFAAASSSTPLARVEQEEGDFGPSAATSSNTHGSSDDATQSSPVSEGHAAEE